MNNIKKLLLYPLALVVFFGFTANTCLDSLGEELDITVPFKLDDTSFKVEASEAVTKEESKMIDLSEVDKIEEYKDRIKDAKAKSISISVTDNLQNDAVAEGDFKILYDGISFPLPEILGEGNNIMNYDGKTFTIEEIDPDGDLEGYLQTALLNGGQVIFIYDYETTGPVDYTVDIIIDAELTASASGS